MKNLYIAEKPSVAAEFGKALKVNGKRQNGYIESEDSIVTWCVGHLITMSYPDKYDIKYKRWSLDTLPFIPKVFKYEVIDGVKNQFNIVSNLLKRDDVGCIYICTDSGREGEYIYRLVDQMAGVLDKTRKRVWIDSQTEEEILRGIGQAKDWTEYDNLAASAYLRAKEDYLMGINFSRILTLKYGSTLSNYLKVDRTVLSVGRVMTCVLGMVVRREREIREFVKIPFYRVIVKFGKDEFEFEGEWRVVKGSKYFESPKLYRDNGFAEIVDAKNLLEMLKSNQPYEATVVKTEKKKELKNPPLLYNLAEIQNECSKKFKISPDATLKIIQELYEKKLVTYPRTDARVLSTAVTKEIYKNISGLSKLSSVGRYAEAILKSETYKNIAKTRYTNDAQITDHYAIIPTGQGLGTLKSLSSINSKVYELICRRFLSIFYPAAVYEKFTLEISIGTEHFFTSFRLCKEQGFQEVAYINISKTIENKVKEESDSEEAQEDDSEGNIGNPEFIKMIEALKKGNILSINDMFIKEGETSPPKRYASGTMILAMENAGQLIEDDELRSQIKGSGIGTSATRAEILKKLCNIKYLALNNKTQIVTPTLLGEMIFDTVYFSIRQLLNPELTASWEKGLNYVAEGTITCDEYMEKLDHFVSERTNQVLKMTNQYNLRNCFDKVAINYKTSAKKQSTTRRTK